MLYLFVIMLTKVSINELSLGLCKKTNRISFILYEHWVKTEVAN